MGEPRSQAECCLSYQALFSLRRWICTCCYFWLPTHPYNAWVDPHTWPLLPCGILFSWMLSICPSLLISSLENMEIFLMSEETELDFPGGTVVKNLPGNAGDTGSIPGQETKIPHAAEQLSLSDNYWAHTLKSACYNQRAHKLQPESPCATMKDPAWSHEDLRITTKTTQSNKPF